jgi:hypothetical protein
MSNENCRGTFCPPISKLSTSARLRVCPSQIVVTCQFVVPFLRVLFDAIYQHNQIIDVDAVDDLGLDVLGLGDHGKTSVNLIFC